VKVALAQEIVARFHSQTAAEQALEDFEARFKQNAIPSDLSQSLIPCGSSGIGIAQLLKQAGLTPSTSEALRLIDQGGVKIDGEKVSDRGLVLPAGTDAVFQVGKRKFARVRLT
ncbi:MAG: S4 domain-containing protein, partial [Pseudomonadota bacterium]|nr:S4 domain-containing protein [Pseudomonadota bacterium]